jgi:hypothetical protein
MSHVRVKDGARRPLRVIAAAALAVCVVSSASAAFAADPPTTDGNRVLGVSVPPDSLNLKPGDTKTIDVKITNAGSRAFPVTIEGRALHLGDDGAVSIDGSNDVRWENQVDFPHGELMIPALGWKDAAITIRMPAVIEPDTYLIGFVVSPVASQNGSVKVVNQIATFLTVDVPGPRNRRVKADFDAPGTVFGTHAVGKVRVRNVGHVMTRFWAETDVTSSPGGGVPKQGRLAKTLLPAGRVKTFSITGSPHYPIGFVTMKARITYPGTTDASTRELVITRRVLVIHPFVLYGAFGLLVLAIVWFVRRRVRRTRARRPATKATARPRPSDPRERSTRRPVRVEATARRSERYRERFVEEPEEAPGRVARRARRGGIRGWFGGRSAPARGRPERPRASRTGASTRGGSRRSRHGSRGR